MKEDMFEFVKFELLDSKGRLEQAVLKIPLEQRKPIYERIKRLDEIIQDLEKISTEKSRKIIWNKKEKQRYIN